MGTNAMPDMYALSPRASGIQIRQGICAHIGVLQGWQRRALPLLNLFLPPLKIFNNEVKKAQYIIVNAGVELDIYSKLPHPLTKLKN